MLDALTHLFSALCGQNPDHTWSPGGFALPCCQRCLGLYVGAAVAAALHLWLRPRPTARFLKAHGLFLLLMVPSGLHWIPQAPALRAVSGGLFGFGVAAFLWLPVSARLAPRAPAGSPIVYPAVLAATLALTPLLGRLGGAGAAYALAALAAAGAGVLLALTLADLVLAFALLSRGAQPAGQN